MSGSCQNCLNRAGPDTGGRRVNQCDRRDLLDSRGPERPGAGRHRYYLHDQTRVRRRVARTKATIYDAFVQLALEREYKEVAVENISDRAGLARAT